MTDEVADLVLRDNYEQNVALGQRARRRAPLLHVHERWIRTLERARPARPRDRVPADAEGVRRRADAAGRAYPTRAGRAARLHQDRARRRAARRPTCPTTRSCAASCTATSRRRCAQRYSGQMDAPPAAPRDHRRPRSSTTWSTSPGSRSTTGCNQETGAPAAELASANLVVREIFGTNAIINEIERAGQRRSTRASRPGCGSRCEPWSSGRPGGWSTTGGPRSTPRRRWSSSAPPSSRSSRSSRTWWWDGRRTCSRAGAIGSSRRGPRRAGRQVASMPPAYAGLGVVETSRRDDIDPLEVARVHFDLAERLTLSLLTQRILALPRNDRWQTMARAALRDDLHVVHASLTAQVLAETTSGQDPGQRVVEWEERDRWRSPGRWARWRRSAPTSRPTSPGSRSVCGSYERSWPAARRSHRRLRACRLACNGAG